MQAGIDTVNDFIQRTGESGQHCRQLGAAWGGKATVRVCHHIAESFRPLMATGDLLSPVPVHSDEGKQGYI